MTTMAIKLAGFFLLGLWCVAGWAAGRPPACSGASVRLTPDYRFVIGSSSYADAEGDPEAGSAFRWLRNGSNFSAGIVAEGLLLHFDDTAAGGGRRGK